jgi:hypothetical protein
MWGVRWMLFQTFVVDFTRTASAQSQPYRPVNRTPSTVNETERIFAPNDPA